MFLCTAVLYTAMAHYQVNYKGLRARPTFDTIVNYLQTKQEKIKYPDRTAKRLRESPYLTQLDGEGMGEMDEQQEKAMLLKQLDDALRMKTAASGDSANERRAMGEGVSSSSSSGSGSYRTLSSRPSEAGSVPPRPLFTTGLNLARDDSEPGDDLASMYSATVDDVEEKLQQQKQQEQEQLKSLKTRLAHELATKPQTVAEELMEMRRQKQMETQMKEVQQMRHREHSAGSVVARSQSPAHRGSTADHPRQMFGPWRISRS